MQSQLKAVIFDMDGVITDTVRYHFLSWKRLAREEDVDFTEKDNEKLLGLSRNDSLNIFLKGRPISDTKRIELLNRKNQYFLEYIKNFTEKDLLPGVHDLILSLKQTGLRLAVASSSKNARLVIEKLGVTPLFDCITDGYEAAHAKPAPDLFLIAATKLNMEPERCLVIEDSAAGIEAALKAHMLTVGVGPAERLSNAHLRFDSMAEIDLDKVMAL